MAAGTRKGHRLLSKVKVSYTESELHGGQTKLTDLSYNFMVSFKFKSRIGLTC